MDRPVPPPEATLIRTARKAADLTVEAAAGQAGALSFVRWSQIENGYERRGGKYNPVRGTDTHIAHMAHVVGISPERLEQAGRPDAAIVLREIILQAQLAAQREAAGAPPRRRFDDPRLQRMWDEHEGELPDAVLLGGIGLMQMILANLDEGQRSA